MARGAEAKEYITKKIYEAFPEAFANNKEIRIPYMENGERVEIKITLTAAKENVGGGAVVTNGVTQQGAPFAPPAPQFVNQPTEVAELTQEEKDNVAALMKKLGFSKEE